MSSLELNVQESERLTLDLAGSWNNRAYAAASGVMKMMLEMGSTPEEFDPQSVPAVREQLEISQAIIKPYVGRVANAGTTIPVKHTEEANEWYEKSMQFGERPILSHLHGIIRGIEGHVVRPGMDEGRIKERPGSGPNYSTYKFYIGIILEEFGGRADRIDMVPIHDFPNSWDAGYRKTGIVG